MKIVGLDISSCTGYAVVEGNKLIESGKIKLKAKLDHRARFKMFRSEISKIIEAHKPDGVVLEGVYSGKNVKTAAYLNNLRGIAIEVTPSDIHCLTTTVKGARKGVLNSGSVSKEEVFSWAVKKYKIKAFTFKKDNDITDAILLANWGILKLTDPSR